MEKIREEVQQKALNSWLNVNKKGTLEIVTGLGKTFIALHALNTMPKNDKKIHLFLAETTSRKKDLFDDIKKYNKIFKTNILRDYNLKFYCYQSAYKWKDKKFGLVIGDELHDALSPSYSQFFFNNNYDAIIGLSATINKATKYLINNKVLTKGELLDKIAPICFTYTLDESSEAGTSRKLDIYVIQHKLDIKDKTIKAGNAKKVFYQTEEASYKYWDARHKKSWYIEDIDKKNLQIRITSTKRSNILYNLESKIKPVKELLNNIKGKTILFGNSLSALEKVTPNVVSSNNSEDKNKQLREDFDNNKIQIIGSFKKLKQGSNLKDLDNVIIMSYYSTEKDLIQRLGRLRNKDKIGNVFIFVTMGTQEEVWFSKMFENVNSFNMIYCPDVEFAINKIK